MVTTEEPGRESTEISVLEATILISTTADYRLSDDYRAEIGAAILR